MNRLEQISRISIISPARIVLIVMDGLGGLPDPESGKTELETARTPNLDALAKRGVCGLLDPVSPGFTPGSGPGHLALFGYDPFEYEIGRGILEALGIDFPLKEGDVAARGNFCTIDEKGNIIDRRAGRISTDKAAELCERLSTIKVGDIETFVTPVRGHRFLLVLRGADLHPDLSDSDPSQVGAKPKRVAALDPKAKKTARLVESWTAKAKKMLHDAHPANMVLLRGFSAHPKLPTMQEIYKLRPAAIATYPMYRGLAKLVGMDIVPLKTESSIKQEFGTLVRNYSKYDYFFLHIKQTDAAGEDGNFAAKVKAIEDVDAALPPLLDLEPDVVMVTGDHSTPALLKAHSWHPVPFLLYSKWCRTDETEEFSERACVRGGLGRMPTLDITPLAMANALKLTKFGA